MYRLIPFAALCVALAGCADPYAGQKTVSGKVTLAGQPIEKGMIMFDPLGGQGTASGSAITNGDYKLEGQAGLKPGKYRVRITAGDGKTPASEEEAGGPSTTNIVSVDLVPEEWNVRSDKEIEVKSDGDNKFDFTIPNKVDPS